ncbi:MAG TPA: inositol monophosphatase family protein [Deinococcales bacterium]|nr:inositol monophosphatase family protein [Deinococcales bacterium]
MTDYSRFLDTAVRAARRAGGLHLSYRGGELGIQTKSTEADLVTVVDRAAEEAIREEILADFPDHAILGEEGGEAGGSASGALWVVDPLDGTVNYAHGFPFYCVSIALDLDGRTVVGAVLDAVHDELFTATLGGGAFLNGRPIHVSAVAELTPRSMLATGFPYDVEGALASLTVFQRFLLRNIPVRRPGAAALDLCSVACGRFDGFWEGKLNAWDCAAGNLIIQEAGGTVTNVRGEPFRYEDRPVVASNGLIHQAILDVLNAES